MALFQPSAIYFSVLASCRLGLASVVAKPNDDKHWMSLAFVLAARLSSQLPNPHGRSVLTAALSLRTPHPCGLSVSAATESSRLPRPCGCLVLAASSSSRPRPRGCLVLTASSSSRLPRSQGLYVRSRAVAAASLVA